MQKKIVRHSGETYRVIVIILLVMVISVFSGCAATIAYMRNVGKEELPQVASRMKEADSSIEEISSLPEKEESVKGIPFPHEDEAAGGVAQTLEEEQPVVLDGKSIPVEESKMITEESGEGITSLHEDETVGEVVPTVEEEQTGVLGEASVPIEESSNISELEDSEKMTAESVEDPTLEEEAPVVEPMQQAFSEESISIAIVPFTNAGGNEADDYIGFQISEFLTSAMFSYRGVTIIERGQLNRIIQEQELQLTGLTDAGTAIEIGQLSNATRILVGSYTRTKEHLHIAGRIVDVATGEVMASAVVEGSATQAFATYRAFLFQLLSSQSEYRMTIPFEAAVQSLESQSMETSDNFAKALLALYEEDYTSALEYLGKSISGADVDFYQFNEIATEYSKLFTYVEGQSLYANLINRQIEQNKKILEPLVPMNTYRNTLKILAARVDELLTPANIDSNTTIADQNEWKLKNNSVEIPLPSTLQIGLKESVYSQFDRLMDQQDILGLKEGVLDQKAWESDILLSFEDVAQFMNLSWLWKSEIAIQFKNALGEVLYEIGSAGPVLEMSGEAIKLTGAMEASYCEKEPVSGWYLDPVHNTVEVQARAIKDLASVHLEVRETPGQVSYQFGAMNDIVWNSILSHVTKIKTSNIFTSENTSQNPFLKDVIFTNAVFYTGNDSIDPVPLIIDEDTLYGNLDLWAFVYLAENHKGTVAIEWNGRVFGTDVQSGDYHANDWIVFNTNRREYVISPSSNDITLQVSIDGFTEQYFATATRYAPSLFVLPQTQVLPAIHERSVRAYGDDYLFVQDWADDYGFHIMDRNTEKDVYTFERHRMNSPVVDGNMLYYGDTPGYGENKIRAFNMATLEYVWESEYLGMPQLVDGDVLYTLSNSVWSSTSYANTFTVSAYDIHSGTLIGTWKASFDRGSKYGQGLARLKKVGDSQFVVLTAYLQRNMPEALHFISTSGDSFWLDVEGFSTRNIFGDRNYLVVENEVYNMNNGGLVCSLNTDGYLTKEATVYLPSF